MSALQYRSLHRLLAPYLFVGPAVLAVVVFLYGPIVGSAALSVLDWNLLSSDIRFVGTANYVAMFASADFQLSAWNTLLYCAILIPAQIILPLILALMIHSVRGSRMDAVYRGMLFLPTILAFSVAGVAWSWLLNPVNGLFNEVLTSLGLARLRWHTDPDLALPCVALITFWKTFGLNMLLWLAALANVPHGLREASRLDGASRWQYFWTIELPMITPTAFFISVTTLFHILDDIVGVIDVLTHGGPAGRSSSILYFLWQQGMQFFQFGQASAVAMIIIVVVLSVTWMQFRIGEKRVHYG
ncbi:sugar ABC transporter permease [Mesorhizobium sp. VK25A]|uniref:Sugar ABC transporter permease n=1 Tax=Mesorhizobium vachelliae TaxID=3072309 RepID=A0ABU5A2H6_9HYPH|nr:MULTISPECIES: sugar ABC transporter permease [unclassified Mesorhizobium]MDX8531900.1 sugar ABC transporter permease [Mesorhizobium sp. VK25D]MDX8543657.1 sugar ABC transporter permease [Mesorhizobium sp. VK25A]